MSPVSMDPLPIGATQQADPEAGRMMKEAMPSRPDESSTPLWLCLDVLARGLCKSNLIAICIN